MRTGLLISVLAIPLLSGPALAGLEINTTLMQYTYHIVGPTGKPNEMKHGTVFVMGIPDANQPGKGQFVLVTAAHVLEEISGEKATIYLREKMTNGKFKRIARSVKIRNGKKPLWTSHPSVDVAVMKIALPVFVSKQAEDIPMLSTDMLADDKMIEEYEIHPGDRLLCLGYPLGVEANVSGFPILRAGIIASYPLIPAKDTKSFLFDFEVFGGNSGGPVYFVDKGRTYAGSVHIGETIQFVAGIVTQQKYSVQRSVKPLEVGPDRRRYEVEEKREKLKLAVVVPAHFIKETLALLDKKQVDKTSQQGHVGMAPTKDDYFRLANEIASDIMALKDDLPYLTEIALSVDRKEDTDAFCLHLFCLHGEIARKPNPNWSPDHKIPRTIPVYSNEGLRLNVNLFIGSYSWAQYAPQESIGKLQILYIADGPMQEEIIPKVRRVIGKHRQAFAKLYKL